MRLLGYVCHAGTETPGRRNRVEFCLGECKNPCVTPPLLAAMYKADTGNYHQGDYISSSMLAGNNCARQVQYERGVFDDPTDPNSGFYELPQKRYWPFRGTHAHSICEGAHELISKYGWLQEIRTSTVLEYDLPAPLFTVQQVPLTDYEISVAEQQQKAQRNEQLERLAALQTALAMGDVEYAEMRERVMQAYAVPVPTTVEYKVFTGQYNPDEALKITVRGTADAYNPLTRTLADMKSMADKKADMVILGEKPGTISKNLEDSWVWQFNIYRFLLARTTISPDIRAHFKELGLKLTKAKTFPAPTRLIMQGIGMMEIPRSGSVHPKKGKYGSVTLHEIDAIPVIPMQEIEEYIRPKALMWYRYLNLKQLAPVVPASMKWLCSGCAFNGEKIAGERCFPEKERAEAKE